MIDNAPPGLSEPEVLVFQWLTRHKIPFATQVNMMGGKTERGGAKVDFYLIDLQMIIRVQSYWHTIGPARARDILQKIQLENQGYMVVDVFEDDLYTNLDRTMNAAMKGQEVHD